MEQEFLNDQHCKRKIAIATTSALRKTEARKSRDPTKNDL